MTLRAKIKKINPRPTHGNLDEYRIELEDPDGQTATSKTVRKAMLYVGNRWHYDYQHGGIFVGDVFGLALKEGDIIIVVGMARRHDDFETTYRYITVRPATKTRIRKQATTRAEYTSCPTERGV